MAAEQDRERFLELIAAAERVGRELEPLVDAEAQPLHREAVAAALLQLDRTRERVHDGTFRTWPRDSGLGLTRPFYEFSHWPAEIEARVDAFGDALGAVEAFWATHQDTLVGA